MGDCKHCKYAIYDLLWTEYKCALKHFDIPNPPEEFGCKSYQKGRPRRSRFWKEPKLRKPGDKVIVENGTFYADGDLMTGYRSVTVKVPESKDPILQEKTIDISKNGTYTIVADASYDGLVRVIINVDIEHSGSSTTAVVGRAIVGCAIVGEG